MLPTHARRKFVNVLNEDKDLAGKALEYIGLLYQIEESLKSKNLNIEQIAQERKRLAYPMAISGYLVQNVK